MFRISNKTTSTKLFTNTNSMLVGNSLKIYEAKESWHNQFRVQVVERIDERIFSKLFSDGQGAPNASIRILIGMMILKESQGWSDDHLFDQCRFNLLVRSALGMLNIDDSPPVPSTYYLFRKRIVSWENEGNGNLLEQVFAQVTKSQAIDFNVNGKSIRMDSKLIGSNIAWYSRYELIHETLRLAYRYLREHSVHLILSDTDTGLLNTLTKETGDKVCYRSSKAEVETKMSALGAIIYKILQQTKKHQAEAIGTLRRVFQEQYSEKEGIVDPLPKQAISATSVQSPHDTDCHYRKKNDKQVKGYSVNVTETCDGGDQLKLVTHVSVDTASAADNDFLQPAIAATQKIVAKKIDKINADGAYHSVENQEYCKQNEIDLVVGGIQGCPPRYDLSLGESGELRVTDLQTNEIIPSRRVEPRKEGAVPRWAIRSDKNKNRYFTEKDIDTCLLRHSIENRTTQELNVRNNVEATVFQLGYHYPHAKSRYRGLFKHKMWANIRCMWVNFARISKYIIIRILGYAYEVANRYFLPISYAHKTGNKSFLHYFFLIAFNPTQIINIVVSKNRYYSTYKESLFL